VNIISVELSFQYNKPSTHNADLRELSYYIARGGVFANVKPSGRLYPMHQLILEVRLGVIRTPGKIEVHSIIAQPTCVVALQTT